MAEAGVHRLGDVVEASADPQRLDDVERALARVRGHGGGARLSYLWMLAGDEHHIEPDRMVLQWLARHLRRWVTVPDARQLIAELADGLSRTPWEVDHAIWRYESGGPDQVLVAAD